MRQILRWADEHHARNGPWSNAYSGRVVLAPLAALAARLGVAVVGVMHLRKGEGPAMYRAMGSLAFVAAARAVWAVSKDRNDETGNRRLFLPVKCNLARDPTGLAYELRPADNGTAVVAWERDPVTTKADDALALFPRKRGPEPETQREAARWLRSALANGPRRARELYKEAWDEHKISERTLDRAKAELGVKSARSGPKGPW